MTKPPPYMHLESNGAFVHLHANGAYMRYPLYCALPQPQLAAPRVIASWYISCVPLCHDLLYDYTLECCILVAVWVAIGYVFR